VDGNQKKYKSPRKEVAHFMRRLYKHGLTTTSGGNISIRLDDETILITATGTDKGRMKWKEVGIVNIFGENLTAHLKPSMETEMHLAIYKKKKEVRAIIHAHPVYASLFTAIKSKIQTNLTAEARAILGDPVFVKYAVVGSTALAQIAAENISKSDILLLENHGILTTGKDLLQAFDKIEVLENAAKMTLITKLTGRKKPLDKARILELERIFR
jgi:L-fuculose-phosphate aldolase